jgi:hypothetical protein
MPAAVWAPRLATVACVAGVIVVTLWQLHPSLLLSSSIPTGGDNGGHYAMPAYLWSGLLSHGQLTGWDPGWYDGFPLYTYYFLLPDLFAAVLGGHIISYALAFKWITVLGSVLLPVAAWAMGRLFGMRRAFPGAIAALTLGYLFDYTYTIYGGNLFSTLAGEYSYSFSIALALLFLGLMARGLRTGRHRGWAAVTLAACVLAHFIPALFALAGAVLLIGMEMLPDRIRPRDSWYRHPTDEVVPQVLRRPQALWWGVSTVGIGMLLVAFWWVPFGIDQPYATSLNYQNIHTYVTLLFPQADLWVLILAGLSALAALALRSRFGILMGALAGIFAAALIFDPQRNLFNTRFLPLWFLPVYLLAGWGVATAVTGAIDLWGWWRQQRYAALLASIFEGDPLPMEGTEDHGRDGLLAYANGSSANGDGSVNGDGAANGAPSVHAVLRSGRQRAQARLGERWSRWPTAGVVGPLVALFVALLVVVTPFVLSYSTMQSLGITPGPNQVTNWSSFNYQGYQGQAAYPEYRALIQTMEHVGDTYGCGQAMWQYDPSLNRFGTTQALYLLPYWSNGCIGSMEGLLFESAATTPYHFLNQAELSVNPSEPMVGLDYSSLNVPQGIQHLQLLGVRYFMASSPTVQAAAAADHSLRLVAQSGPWTSTQGATTTTTTWMIYEVLHSPVVVGLSNKPAVQIGIGAGQSSWLTPSENWYNDPSRWNVFLAQSGPASWPRVAIGDPHPPARHVAPTRVTHVAVTDNSVRFHVSHIGTPVLVKVSYFPNWHASGATGPYRVTPNLMVVVPTSHNVVLAYGATGANRLGQAMSLLGLVALVTVVVLEWVRRRRAGEAALVRSYHPGDGAGTNGARHATAWPAADEVLEVRGDDPSPGAP